MRITGISPFACGSPVTDWVFVRVDTDQPGLVGWGEASLPGKHAGVCGAVEDVSGLILGADPTDTEWCWQRIYRHAYWRGGPIQTSALSGIDVALWDIRGKLAGQPIHKLLGGPVRDRVRLYANCGLATEPEVFRTRVGDALALGYTAVKIYPLPATGPVAGPALLRQVVACCEAVRDELGPDRDFAVDCHGRMTAAVAVEVEAAIRHTHPLWLEEPVAPESPQALARCAEKFTIPIAVGERLFTRWAFRDLLEHQWAGILQPDVSNAGGITELAKIAQLAELYGVGFAPHNPNGPLQTWASLHLAAHAQAFAILEHRHEPPLQAFMRKIADAIVEVEADGHAALPAAAGLGTAIDEGALAAHPPQRFVHESFRSDGSIGDW